MFFVKLLIFSLTLKKKFQFVRGGPYKNVIYGQDYLTYRHIYSYRKIHLAGSCRIKEQYGKTTAYIWLYMVTDISIYGVKYCYIWLYLENWLATQWPNIGCQWKNHCSFPDQSAGPIIGDRHCPSSGQSLVNHWQPDKVQHRATGWHWNQPFSTQFKQLQYTAFKILPPSGKGKNIARQCVLKTSTR